MSFLITNVILHALDLRRAYREGAVFYLAIESFLRLSSGPTGRNRFEFAQKLRNRNDRLNPRQHMNVIRGAVYLQRRTMQSVYQPTKIVMQPWSKFGGDQWRSILGSIDYVIERIRV